MADDTQGQADHLLMVRLSADLYRWVRAEAYRQQCSINDVVVAVLSAQWGEGESYTKQAEAGEAAPKLELPAG